MEMSGKIIIFAASKLYDMAIGKPQETRYMNPLTDYGFKKLFGDREVMQAFLTDLLEPKSPITEITFLDKEMEAQSQYERGVIYDLRCKTADGGEFIVEMQNKSQRHFSDRILFYLSRSFSNQEERGCTDWDYQLRPVYGIFFLNFHLKGFKPLSVRTVQLKVEETGEVFSDKLRAYTLELAGYEKMEETDCKTRIDYWLYNLTNLENMTSQIPFQQQQPIFGRVGNIAELVHMNAEERAKYNISIDSYRSNLSAWKYGQEEARAEGLAEGRAEGRAEGLAEGLAEGRAEGRAEGLAKGRAEEKIENAKALKANGVPVNLIATSLGLPIETIESL